MVLTVSSTTGTLSEKSTTVVVKLYNNNNRRRKRRAPKHRPTTSISPMPETSLPPDKLVPFNENTDIQNNYNHNQTNPSTPDNEERDCNIIRIIIQALRDHGYEASATTLETESGVPMEPDTVRHFRLHILEGNWDEALIVLPLSNQIKFEILQERYLELLEARRMKEALNCLRKEVTPLAPDSQCIQQLASLMMASSSQEVRVRAQWTGAGLVARQALLDRIQTLMPGVMLPHRRLRELLHQALLYQQGHCRNHYPGPWQDGIVSDHHCRDMDLFLRLNKSMRGHEDEVWFAAFSHNGQYLATASKDSVVIIWTIPEGQPHKILKEHSAGVLHVAWSPDDHYLLTCSADGRARLFDLQSGACQQIFSLGGDSIVGGWDDKGDAVIIGTQDGILTKFSLEGTVLHRLPLRTQDMVTIKGDRVAVLDNQNTVHILRMDNLQESFKFSECAPISSLTADKSGVYFLLNSAETEAEVNLWGPSETMTGTYDVIRTLYGHTNRKYCLRSCFGHSTEALIINGCEQGNIYVHHRENGHLLQKLPAHDGVVNCVTWTDAYGGVLASVGDDRQVCLWTHVGSI